MAASPHVAPRPAQFADWQPVVTFVHVSDVQLRDFGIKRPAAVDRNDESPALALIGGIGKMTPAPSFVIHTGDAIDAGSVGELARFLWIMNRLAIPWFSVIGNHDVFLMGNFTHDCSNVKGLPPDGVPLIADRRKFMALHGPGSDWPHAAPPHEPTLVGNDVDAIWVVLLVLAGLVGAPLRWLLLIGLALQVPVALLFVLARRDCMPMMKRDEAERPSRYSCHRALHDCVDQLITAGCAQPPAPGSLPEGTEMMNALSCAASVNRCHDRLAACRGAP